MSKPDWCPQEVWNEACDARAMAGGSSVVEALARAILAAEKRGEKREREAIEADLAKLQTLIEDHGSARLIRLARAALPNTTGEAE